MVVAGWYANPDNPSLLLRWDGAQRHYSTARREEMRVAVGKVISLAMARVRHAPNTTKRAQ